jgi:hypothetical protein
VADPVDLVKAELIELTTDFKGPASGAKPVVVQFNPETLKVSFANQLEQKNGAGDTRGQQGRQFIGASTTKLSLQLWVDVTAPPYASGGPHDVREVTKKVAHFITPKKLEGGKDAGRLVPPAVRFRWGTFRFDGMVDSLDESLEFWSRDGTPLRASLQMAMSQQGITFLFNPAATPGSASAPGTARAAVGTRPLDAAPQGSSVQGLAGAAGRDADWQSIAQANGIDDPRRLPLGSLLDLNAGR